MKIGIVGAGIVGRLLSVMLSQRGHRVTIFDKTHASDHSTCSFVAAGMLSPYAELESGDPELFNLAKDAIQRWQTIIPKLVFAPTFEAKGSIMLARSQETAELNHFIQRANRLNIDLKMIGSQTIGELEPALADQNFTGIHLEEEGYIDTEEMMRALYHTALESDVDWHENTKVIAIKKQTIFTQEEQFEFDQVFDCRGVGAKGAMEDLRAVRGEIIWVQAPEVNLTRPIRLLHPRYALYIVPRFDNHYIIGATSIESEDYSPISVQSALELLTACYSIHPGFAEARIVYTATQCRPAFSSHLPKIVRTQDCIRINGMYRHGYLLAPKIVSAACAHLNRQIKEGVNHEAMAE